MTAIQPQTFGVRKSVSVYTMAMSEKPKRGRPSSPDPREPVTLRLPGSLVRAYRAKGNDWRARMEAAIKDGLAPRPRYPTAPDVSQRPEPQRRQEPPRKGDPPYNPVPRKIASSLVPLIGTFERKPIPKGTKK